MAIFRFDFTRFLRKKKRSFLFFCVLRTLIDHRHWFHPNKKGLTRVPMFNLKLFCCLAKHGGRTSCAITLRSVSELVQRKHEKNQYYFVSFFSPFWTDVKLWGSKLPCNYNLWVSGHIYNHIEGVTVRYKALYFTQKLT